MRIRKNIAGGYKVGKKQVTPEGSKVEVLVNVLKRSSTMEDVDV